MHELESRGSHQFYNYIFHSESENLVFEIDQIGLK